MTLTLKRRTGLVLCTAVAALISLGATTTLPASAADADSAPLIDKPFEDAVIKHFQKRFFNRIDASADQRQKLSAIIGQRADETRPVREQLRRKVLELNQMMVTDGVTEEQLVAKSHEVRDIRSQLMDDRFQSMLKVRAVLTPEQRKQISERVSGIITGQWHSRLKAML